MGMVTVLPLRFKFENIDSFIYPAIISDNKHLTLIDCGYPNFLPIIESAMIHAGLTISDLKNIVITHHDHDHMGALKEITDKYPSIEVFSSKAQKPYITGEAKSLRLIQAEEHDQFLSDEEKIESRKFMDIIRSVRTVAEVTELSDGDSIPFSCDAQVIDTSGHMPGHFSVYIPSEKTLIAGDALAVFDGKLCIANPEYVLDMPEAINSIKKLMNYDIESVICYHGGVYCGDIKCELQRILSENTSAL